ncbi:cysteine proteinase [Rhizoclosmatium globosum]|uniref:Cysteine proteinase n=1 Tax=Rhizoclosmatium globosum TaxID=329046 RepID=A0A1Y2BK90_9FUNG|nr:cysteine proteinase [Rhizoclosmatium globosum]|eukprot:ORY35191.1 cysteine proteinase [Rhizoclosmatium globosum]
MTKSTFTSINSFPGLSGTQLEGYLDRIGLNVTLPISADLRFRKRGGYCYNNNIILFAALKSIGFTVKTGIARVTPWDAMQQAFDLGPPQHLILLIELNGRTYLADMGNNRMSEAIEVVDGAIVNAAADETYQIRRTDLLGQGDFALWFKRAPWAPFPDGADSDGFIPYYVAMNVYIGSNPCHTLQTTFIVSNVTKTFGRTAVTDMVFRRREGAANRDLECVVEIKTVGQLKELMAREYGVELTEVELEGARKKYCLAINNPLSFV